MKSKAVPIDGNLRFQNGQRRVGSPRVSRVASRVLTGCLALIIAIICPWVDEVRAQAGCEDFSFSPEVSLDWYVNTVVPLPDGRLMIGGAFSAVNGQPARGVARLTADGSLDPTFRTVIGGAGFFASPSVDRILRLPNGEWIVAGSLAVTNAGVVRTGVVKLFANGELDPDYIASVPPGSFYALALDGQGRVLVGGSFGVAGYTNLVRLTTNGAVDQTFARNAVSGLEGYVSALAIQAHDQKVIVAARFRHAGAIRSLARLESDGSPDLPFLEASTGPSQDVSAVAVMPNRQLLFGYPFSGLSRLNSDGTWDDTWTDPGVNFSGVRSIEVSVAGDVAIGSEIFSNGRREEAVVRIRAGETWAYSVVSSSADRGRVRAVWAPKFTANGDVIAAIGYVRPNADPFAQPSSGLARIKYAEYDFDYGALSLLAWWIEPTEPPVPLLLDLALQPDGRLLVAGSFDRFAGAAWRHIARLHPDGKPDSSFLGITSADGYITKALVLTNRQILVGGWFSTIDGLSRGRIARLHEDGRLDVDFLSGLPGLTGGGVSFNGLAVQPADQKILVGGSFSSVNGVSRPYLARLHSDGRLDATFLSAAGTGPNAYVGPIVVQSDGKILIGGGFDRVSGVPRDLLARLHPDGRVDESFDARLVPDASGTGVQSIVALDDGRILVAGRFTSVHGTPRPRLARLHPDGTLDTTFLNIRPGPDEAVTFASVQPDGKYLITGAFDYFNGQYRGGLARLLSDGTIDGTYPGWSGCVGRVDVPWDPEVQPDGRLIVIDTSWPTLTRLHGDDPPSFSVRLTNQVVRAGADVFFSVQVASATPVQYQWFVDGVPAPGATATNRFSLYQIGYDSTVRVVVTNLFGGGASSEANVEVVYDSGQELRPVAGAVASQLPPSGPAVEPAGGAVWRANQLFAVDPGRVIVSWKDVTGGDLIGRARIEGRLESGWRHAARLNPIDGQSPGGRFADVYRLGSLAAGAEYVAYATVAGGFEPRLMLHHQAGGAVVAVGDGVSGACLLPLTSPPASGLALTVTSVETNQVGQYEVGLYPVVRPGQAIDGQLAAGDPCDTSRTAAVGAGRWYHDDYLLPSVGSGDRLTVRVEPSSFAPFIEARLLVDESPQRYVDGSVLEFGGGESGPPRDYLIRVTTSASGALGSYTLDVERASSSPRVWSFSPSAGVPGTRVTIRGTNFLDGLNPVVTGVRFGAAPAGSTEPIDRGAWQEFDAQVPAEAVTGPITVLAGSVEGPSTNDFVVLTPLGAVRLESGGRLSFGVSNAVPGVVNVVEAATELRPPVTWQRVATNAVVSLGVWRYSNANLGLFPQRFFRVRKE